jgi:hypothetical protein
MINKKPDIEAGLKANADLVLLLKGQRVYQQPAPNSQEHPRVTFFEMDNVPGIVADDREWASDIRVQVDIWNQSDTGVTNSEIAEEVDQTMTSLGFIRTGSADFYEDDTKVFHKAMRYRIRVQA